jgi:hypothetical protein
MVTVGAANPPNPRFSKGGCGSKIFKEALSAQSSILGLNRQNVIDVCKNLFAWFVVSWGIDFQPIAAF